MILPKKSRLMRPDEVPEPGDWAKWANSPREIWVEITRGNTMLYGLPVATIRHRAGQEQLMFVTWRKSVKANPAGKPWSTRDTRAIRAAFASLSAKARQHWRSVRPPLPRKRAKALVQKLTGIRANPARRGAWFHLCLGPPRSYDYVIDWTYPAGVLKIRTTKSKSHAGTFGRGSAAQLIRFIRARRPGLPVHVLPA